LPKIFDVAFKKFAVSFLAMLLTSTACHYHESHFDGDK